MRSKSTIVVAIDVIEWKRDNQSPSRIPKSSYENSDLAAQSPRLPATCHRLMSPEGSLINRYTCTYIHETPIGRTQNFVYAGYLFILCTVVEDPWDVSSQKKLASHSRNRVYRDGKSDENIQNQNIRIPKKVVSN